MVGSELWGEFARDPRDPQHAHLRAADADREVIRRALSEAYAEGRLDLDEFDERSNAVATSKLLPELPRLVDDLVPSAPLVLRAITSGVDHRPQAAAAYRAQRSNAFGAFLSVSLICWIIWWALGGQHEGGNLLTGWDPFPWPIFPMLGTGLGLVNTVTKKQELVEKHVAKLERRSVKEAAKRQRRELQQRAVPPEPGTPQAP
ncbi:MAG: DUF1707 domain-containing protein [Nocardioides sp.]